MTTSRAILCLVAGLAIFFLGEHEQFDSPILLILGGVLILLAVVAFIVRIVKAKPPEQPPAPPDFTAEQLLAMKGLAHEKMESLDRQRQALIAKAASEGKTISTTNLFATMERSKQTLSPEAQKVVDDLINQLRERYGEAIPIDEAYRVMKELDPES